MDGKKIVNRSKELEIMNSVFSAYNSSSCVVLQGKSGIGKSSISKKFIDINNAITSFRILSKRSQKDYNYGYYISQLSQEINKICNTDSNYNSIADFIKQQYLKKSKKFLLGALDSLIDTTSLGKIINSGVKNSKKYKGEIEEYFKSFQDDKRFLVIEEYVIQELKDKEFLLNIENIQSIDELSFSTLLKIISCSRKIQLIVEFTDGTDDVNYTITEIVERIQEKISSVKIIKTTALTQSDLLSIFNKTPEKIVNLISKHLIKWNGNVRSIEDLVTEYVYSQDTKNLELINNGTNELIEKLNLGEQIILSIISAHNDKCKISHIKRINLLKEGYLTDIDQTINLLKSKGLIRVLPDEEILIDHDSINASILNSHIYAKHLIFAYKEWLKVYRDLDINGDFFLSESQILSKILLFTSMLNDSINFISLLSRIKEEAINSREPKKFNSLINSFYKKQKGIVSNKILDQIRFWLIEMYLFTESDQEAYLLLNEIEDNSPRKDVLKAILLPRVGMHSDAIKWCTLLLEKQTNKINIELALRLIRMVTYYSIGDETKCSDEFEDIYNNTRYKDCFEYGFLLRNAELVKINSGYAESIPYYKKSISHFLNYKAYRQALSSKITLGIHLCLIGKFREAYSTFVEAQSNNQGNLSSTHTILNNQAVALFYLKRYTEIEDKLTTALQFANEDFNKLVIYTNLFVCFDKLDKDAESLIPIIEEIILHRKFASKDIIRYAYFDIYKYYLDRKNNNLANTYLNKINELSLPLTPHWRHWLYGDKIDKTDPHYYRSRIDRACSFISNWDLEYDSDLMKY